MNKVLVISFTIWLTASSSFLHAQKNKTALVYSEKAVVYVNTDFLISGETLYYSIHCLDNENTKPSTFSKVAYVEMIGENERPFLQTKVSLVKGRGAGDFFLPSTLPSGNYTLIVYTKWMRNFTVENFFQKQITIINPYLKPFSTESQNKISKNNISNRSSGRNIKSETSQVYLTADKKKYSHRQKVVVVIKNSDSVNSCKILLNVRLYDKVVEMVSATSKSDAMKNISVNSLSQADARMGNQFVTFLPDLRGETIGGVVKESVSDRPIANTNVYLSAPGASYVFQISTTDSVGRFYFSAKNIQTENGIRFQVDRSSDSVPLEVMLDDEFANDYEKFKPLPLSIDTSLRRQIEQRNVYSQIENAYFIKKRDSVLDFAHEDFFGKPDKVYKLDDFTRFPTMEDIFREYMYEVVVSKREGKFALQLVNSRTASRFLNTPLILIDGIRVFDTETLMSYNPLLIKKVSLITRQYVYAGILFDGILSINTYTGNAKELPIASIPKDYTSWQHSKKYYSPVYNDNSRLNRIPDYRIQLFWNPTISIDPGQEFIGEFYTSDVEGEFLIEARGLNSAGEAVNIRNTIEVRK